MISRSENISVKSDTSSVTRKIQIKWPEILSLGSLHAAVAISWIAYQEYQPLLVEKFQVVHLSQLLVFTKALVLVFIPILAGWLADKIMVTRGKYFIVYMVGICATAMIFMIVASIITVGPNHPVASFLPIMIVLWLVSMSIFLSPAFSMLESFASSRNLPIAIGVIILITDMIYALEPLVVLLVQFFGESLTFVVGAILVLGTGFVFNKVASDEVMERQMQAQRVDQEDENRITIIPILCIGALVGIGRAFLVEFIPGASPLTALSGQQFAFVLLGISALTAFGAGHYISRQQIRHILPICLIIMILGVAVLFFTTDYPALFTTAGIMVALSFGIAHMSSIPFVFSRVSVRHITFGIGAYLGTSALAEGILEVFYAFH